MNSLIWDDNCSIAKIFEQHNRLWRLHRHEKRKKGKQQQKKKTSVINAPIYIFCFASFIEYGMRWTADTYVQL